MENKKRGKKIVLFILSAVSVLAYLLYSNLYYGIGFPLDDAWIHQTFARNLVLYGEWSFIPGVSSAGSTSPLWTAILSAGYLLRISPVIWSTTLGILLLYSIGLIGENLWKRLSSDGNDYHFPLIGIILIFEWHLVWSALSGMETLLFIVIVLFTMMELHKPDPKWLRLGLLSGAAVWVRPDGVTLLGPILVLAVLDSSRIERVASRLGLIFSGFFISIAPYLLFNYQLDGSLLPNTYFAKQTEYFGHLSNPFVVRIFRLYSQMLIGVGVVVAPGFIQQAIHFVRKRNWWGISAILWLLGYIMLFVLRLPVVYQHARYLMPVMPLFLIISFKGFSEIISNALWKKRFTGFLKKAWIGTLAAVLFVFYGLGAFAYANDVAIIESEMVTAAKWIEKNTPANSVIAAHDIGALGFYGGRVLLDLAGLVNPEVIPFIRDEGRLMAYMKEKNADYLMTFPGWYPEIVRELELIYTTNYPFSPSAGGENMGVFFVK